MWCPSETPGPEPREDVDRGYRLHVQKVKAARGFVDHRLDPVALRKSRQNHGPRRPRRAVESQRARDIEAENWRLVASIEAIFNGSAKTSLLPLVPRPPPFVPTNRERLKLRRRKIDQENDKLERRLIDVAPTVDNRKFAADSERARSMSRRLSKRANVVSSPPLTADETKGLELKWLPLCPNDAPKRNEEADTAVKKQRIQASAVELRDARKRAAERKKAILAELKAEHHARLAASKKDKERPWIKTPTLTYSLFDKTPYPTTRVYRLYGAVVT
ncbi:hypothetical protein DIPPA_30265 [Diplonema papillatum]|nr:hypothetical protein DIPPA_30265 [Diplonema papillatum]